MATRTIQLVILSWICPVFMTSSDTNACFLKTVVNASISCRAGIKECNYSSLKSEFPSLYGQYKSDSPKEVNVTTFCRAEDKSDVELAGLQYQFTPPDHNGVTGIRGFEVRLEGGPSSLSNFRCAVIKLDAFLKLDDVSTSFMSTFYPVRRNSPFIVVVYSLPRQDNSNRNEIHISSESCNTRRVTSGNWEPSYFNVNYDSHSERLNVSFEAPPARFQFDQFKVTLIHQRSIYHHRVNKTEFSIPDIKPGEYEIRVEPYNPQWSDVKHCKCKTTDGQCGGCNVFGKIYNAQNKEVLSEISTSRIDFPQETKDDDSSISSEHLAVIFVPLCLIVCITVGIVVALKRCGLLRPTKERICLLNERVFVELYVDENNPNLKNIAEKLGEIISLVFEDKAEIQIKHENTPGKKKCTLNVYIAEPGYCRERFLSYCQYIQEPGNQRKDSSEEKLVENTVAKSVILTFESVEDDQIAANGIVHFQMMFEISKFLNHINTFINLSQTESNEKMNSARYKIVCEELERLVNEIRQNTENTERHTASYPNNNEFFQGEMLGVIQCRSLSNTNSEPDSGIRSGDEFESLTSSDETMNESTKHRKTANRWKRLRSPNNLRTNIRDADKSVVYRDAGDADKTEIRLANDRTDIAMPRHLKCPPDIHFIAPEPSEYSEYGEDVFFDESNDSDFESMYPVPRTNIHNMHTCIPKVVVYQPHHSNEKIHHPSVKSKGRQDSRCKPSKHLQSSLESLMDQMAALNTRYQKVVENDRIVGESF